jgi:hypothetical protein
VIVLVADQNALTCPPHAMFLVVFLESLQACKYRGIFFWLSILCSESIIAKRIQADCLGLIRIEIFRQGWAGGGQSNLCWRYGDSAHG